MRYRRFYEIDGRHPWRQVSADAYIDYAARRRRGGRVFYFNFELAKEMGLIGRRHPHVVNDALARAVLDAFSLVIINEYDIAHGLRVPAGEMRPHPFMATRYLQCQHPGRTGLTSGDGRSIWNGVFKGSGGTWDISSCGTGATRLSPASAISQRFFKTGYDGSYASGQADLLDGVCAALMSDIFHKNAIPTERTLAVIAFPDGTSINVRAYKNLLRPAHLFRMLKQSRLDDLRAAIGYFIARQGANGDWPYRGDRYKSLLKYVTEHFARAAGLFESEYVFCWLDWDGDNVLMDGAVLDYGSVRQFGLYHHEYRYDDVERMSTTITEQKNKARYIVQTFAQLTDFAATGCKRPLRAFRRHPSLRDFDAVFQDTRDRVLLHKLGYGEGQARLIAGRPRLRRDLRRMKAILRGFERVTSRAGLYEVSDGVTADALFCIRDILRELPAHLANGGDMEPERFIAVMKSHYATASDPLATPRRRRYAAEFQRLYRRLAAAAARHDGVSPRRQLRGMARRAALINRYERVTGDAVLYAAERLVKGARTLKPDDLQAMFEGFVARQVLNPEWRRRGAGHRPRSPRARRVLGAMLQDVKNLRAGL